MTSAFTGPTFLRASAQGPGAVMIYSLSRPGRTLEVLEPCVCLGPEWQGLSRQVEEINRKGAECQTC